jgi:hypothetical protein
MTQPDTGGIIMPQAACRPALRELPRRIDALAERRGIATGTNSAEPEGAVRAHGGDGDIRHLNGITASPGLHVVGMRWQIRRSSTFLDGARHDVAIVAQVVGNLHRRRTRVGSAA